MHGSFRVRSGNATLEDIVPGCIPNLAIISRKFVRGWDVEFEDGGPFAMNLKNLGALAPGICSDQRQEVRILSGGGLVPL